MKKFSTLILIITIILSCIALCAYAEGEEAPVPNKTFEPYDPMPTVTPPENTHPRVFFTAEDIPEIRARINEGENAYVYKVLETYADTTLPTPTAPVNYGETNLNVIEAQAFYYAIFKDDEELSEKAKAVGKKAVDAITYIDYINPGGDNDVTRRWGRMLNVLAEIYDWCYDLLSEEQKITVPNKFRELGQHMEIWKAPSSGDKIDGVPSNQGSVTGHGSEAQLLRDMLSFAIATYDERPDIWNYVGGRYYSEFVPARIFWVPSHFTHQGTDYGFYRQRYDDYAFMLITGMGAEDPYSREDISKTGYSSIYFKRPDGALFRDGDIYSSTTPPYTYQAGAAESLLMEYVMTDDVYLKQELMKVCFTKNGEELIYNNSVTPAIFLIFNKPSVQAKSFYALPNSRYFPSPAGIMTARTNWDEGENSNAVAAVMKIGEYRFNNHQHLDHGHFQLYYKGILASDSGNYNWYADEEHSFYTRKTVAHNAMLVFDPDEYVQLSGTPSIDYRWSPSAGKYVLRSGDTNDGGQRAKYGFGEPLNMDIFNANDMKTASVLAKEIDPQNTQRPYYTYIKGDLTDTYTDKVSDYMRSFMFLDLKNDEIPAALIVFDEITSSNPKFRKTWLIHGPEKPEVFGSKAVFENTAKGAITNYGGRLELTALLPKAEDLTTEVIGGDGNWGTVRRWKYNESKKDWEKTFDHSYNEADASALDENNTYRIEITPKTPKEKDYFLNVMLVSDAGEATGIEPPLIEAGAFYGTTVLDRAVFFAKDGEENTKFSAKLSGEFKYTVCDMKPGRYILSDAKGSRSVYASEDGHIISFEGSGNVSLVWQGIDYKAPSDKEYEDVDGIYANVGDKFISVDSIFTSEEEDFYVELGAFAKAFGYELLEDNGVYMFINGLKVIARIKPEQNKILTERGEKEILNDVIFKDGRCFVKQSDLVDVISGGSFYKGFANTYFATRFAFKEDWWRITGYNTKKYMYNSEISDYEYVYNTVVDVNVMYPLEEDIYLGIFNGRLLKDFKKLEEDEAGHYTVKFEQNLIAEDDELKIFAWSTALSPFSDVIDLKVKWAEKGEYEAIHNRKQTNAWISVTALKNTNSASSAIQTYEKNKTVAEANAHLYVKDANAGVIGEDKLMHYSAVVNNISTSGAGELTQFRVRLNSSADTKSYTSSFLLDEPIGSEYTVDCIVDLKEKKVYLYIDKKLFKTNDISSLTPPEDEQMTVTGFHHYLVASTGLSGGKFQVRDSAIIFYPYGISIEDIIKDSGRVIYQ